MPPKKVNNSQASSVGRKKRPFLFWTSRFQVLQDIFVHFFRANIRRTDSDWTDWVEPILTHIQHPKSNTWYTRRRTKSKCPRRFWEMDPEKLHTYLMCPWGWMGLQGSQTSNEKRSKNQFVKGRAGAHQTHETRAKFQGLILKNGVNIRLKEFGVKLAQPSRTASTGIAVQQYSSSAGFSNRGGLMWLYRTALTALYLHNVNKDKREKETRWANNNSCYPVPGTINT